MPVNSTHPEYRRMQDRWTRCRDVMCGQDAVHGAAEKYLPRLADQTDQEYKAYRERATFYNATWRTIVGLKGMLLRKPPEVDVPEQVKPLLDDVTLSGVPLDQLIETVCEEALGLGRVGLLVDYPSVDTTNLTMADAQRLNLRPTMQVYRAENVVNWRTGRVNNKTVLTMVVLRECDYTPQDEFQDKELEQYRVLTLEEGRYRVRVFQKRVDLSTNKEDWVVVEEVFPMMRGAPLDYIPFVFIGTDDVTPDVDDPPLVDLVNVNLSHYRTTADYEHGAHFTGLPTPYVTGYKSDKENEKLYIGSMTAWLLANKDSQVGFLEFTGQGLGALEKMLAQKEQQMAVLGARMLEPQKKAAESPDSASIRRKGEESMLSDVAIVLGAGVTIALRWWTEWAGADSADVKAELNRDFYPQPMTPDMLNALVSTWQAGAMLTDEELFERLQEGEIIGPDVTFEEVKAALADRGPVLMGGLPGGPAPALPPAPVKTITTPKGEKYTVREGA